MASIDFSAPLSKSIHWMLFFTFNNYMELD